MMVPGTRTGRPVHTYSIVARDPATGELGVAVQSHYFSVGSVVPWAEAGVGAVATQSFVKVDYGPEGVALMREGVAAPQALERLLAADEGQAVRQVAMIDARGNVAAHTGAECVEAAGHLIGDNFSVQANLMVDNGVWPAMKAQFEQAEGNLAERLLQALEAAEAVGGDIRGRKSAALLVVSGERSERPWQQRHYDLRVEDHARPLQELRRLVERQQAYHYMDAADVALEAKDFEQVHHCLQQAMELAPNVDEIKFWAAVALVELGQAEKAMPLFRETFASSPQLADLVPRLVPRGLLPDDEESLARILAQRPGG